MLAQDLQALLDVRPFAPFRIHGTGGLARDVRHPDQAIVARAHVILPIPGPEGATERSELLALAHIVRIETDIDPT